MKTAILLNALPADRYTQTAGNCDPPSVGDIVALDQGFVSSNGDPMVLVYCYSKDGLIRYEAEVYESELGLDLQGRE